MNDIKSRIKRIIDDFYGGKNTNFANSLEIDEANIRNYLKGTEPKASFFEKINEKTEINIEWLISNKGDIIKSKIENIQQKENEDPFQDLTVDKKLDKLYYLLSTCVDKIISMEDEIKKLSNEKEQDKEKSIAKTKSKIEREILKAESVKVDLKHGDTKP
ncbi:hypothetical protein [uncultured Chryseobacterium sp.]|uniref:hypothetical protein n=1 Tax=uncultured Chryseobacterium sp. TaxID=259322 RepID=UPI0025902141|nr:hypothetical protein [uncultured Chryseobacterium sp.]